MSNTVIISPAADLNLTGDYVKGLILAFAFFALAWLLTG
jgi:hypothetical protein